jgi:hypothetical protein
LATSITQHPQEQAISGGTMAHVLDPRRICTDRQYQAARSELDALIGSELDLVAGNRADELIELIENFEGSMRFVPDWSNEPFRRAA